METELLTSPTISSIVETVSSVCVARSPISEATTANPLPASPALAASILAFNARRFVWEEICLMLSVSALIFCTDFACSTAASVFCFMTAYIWSVLWRDSVLIRSISPARSWICPEFFSPSSASRWILSELSLIIPTFSTMCAAFALISSIPAASSCVAAELSSAYALFCSIR